MDRFPCSPDQKAFCQTMRGKRRGPHEDLHHKLFPANLAQDDIDIAVRELDRHKEYTCRCRHDVIHQLAQSTGMFPEWPDRDEAMLQLIEDGVPVDALQSDRLRWSDERVRSVEQELRRNAGRLLALYGESYDEQEV